MIAPLVSIFMAVIVVRSENDLQDCASFGQGQREECTKLQYCKHRNGDGGNNCYPINAKQCKRIKDEAVCNALTDGSQLPKPQICQWNTKATNKRGPGKCNAWSAFTECAELNGQGRRACKHSIVGKMCAYNKQKECTEVASITQCSSFKDMSKCHKQDAEHSLRCIWWPKVPQPGKNDEFECRENVGCLDMVKPNPKNIKNYRVQCEDTQDYGDNALTYFDGPLDLDCLWTLEAGTSEWKCFPRSETDEWECEQLSEKWLCNHADRECDWNKRRDPKCKTPE